MPVDSDNPDSPYRPIEPSLDLASDRVLATRPAATAATVDPAFKAIGARLSGILAETQKTTLAGFRLLDPKGVVIAGREEIGLSLGAIGEVRAALAGRYASALRQRVPNQPSPSLYSVSRGTRVRVFVAMPVAVDGKVAGVVYLSRTPNNIVKHLYGERGKVVLAAIAILGGTLLIGLIFLRTVSRPIYALMERTKRIAAGDRAAIRPLDHHGTREMAALSDAFLDMAEKLHARSDSIQTFATHVSHELKSPLTAIQGAAELLRDSGSAMDEAERRRFSDNIVASCRGGRDRPAHLGRERGDRAGQSHRQFGAAWRDAGFDHGGERRRQGDDPGERRRRRHFAQQPGAHFRAILHHTPRLRRHRHGPRHRSGPPESA